MKNRRQSRILALQVLYACEQRPDDSVGSVFSSIKENSGFNYKAVRYAEILVKSTIAKRKEIDALLQKCASNWEIERMSVIDRNILRLAVTELNSDEKVPFRVVMDEAIEIAKEYGTEQSGKFVNGIIDAVCKEMNK